MITTLEVSVDVDAPAELTWKVVTAWERQGEWMPMTAVKVTADSPVGLGAKISARSGLGRVGFVDPMVIDVWRPPYRCEVAHLGKVVTGRGVFIVDELPGGRSRFTWREELDSTGLRVVIDRVGLLPTKALLTVALKRLSALIASEAA